MPLDSQQPTDIGKSSNSAADESRGSLLRDFGSGVGDKVKAPFKGLGQLITGDVDTPEQMAAQAKAAQSKSYLAGEVVGSAAVFVAATVLIKRAPLIGSLAPIAAGGAIAAVEPLKAGETNKDRIGHGLNGAAAIAIIEHGPKLLSKAGIIATEKSLGGAFISGAVTGGAVEQVNSLIKTGEMASLERTAVAAAGFGLTTTAFRGVGLAYEKGLTSLGERSRLADKATISAISQDRQAVAGQSGERGWHLVCGSGGSKAGLTSTGVILACRAANIKLDTIGGVSGGAIPAAMAAAEIPSHKLIELAKVTDFSGLLDKKKVLEPFLRERKRIDLLQDGMYGSSKLGALADTHVKEWPKKFWTMAVGAESEVMFTRNGVVEYTREGGRHLISSKPAQVGDAIRASCAIPGVLESVTYLGRRLFDGALGRFGKCPTAMVSNHYGVPSENIIASLPVGAMSTVNKGLYRFAQYLSGTLERDNKNFVEQAAIVIRPEVNSFHSMKFLLKPQQKDEAILSGYRSAIEEFASARLISGKRLDAARDAGQSMGSLEQYFKPKEKRVSLVPDPDQLLLTLRKDLEVTH
jgi:hypothetical protein